MHLLFAIDTWGLIGGTVGPLPGKRGGGTPAPVLLKLEVSHPVSMARMAAARWRVGRMVLKSTVRDLHGFA